MIPKLFDRLQASQNVRAYEYIRAQQRKPELIKQHNQIFEEVDILLTPTLPIIPTDINQREVIIGRTLRACPKRIVKIDLPNQLYGESRVICSVRILDNGLPIGFQLIGMHGQEALLYQFGDAYQH